MARKELLSMTTTKGMHEKNSLPFKGRVGVGMGEND
jgi:hypothetical protein